MKTWLTDEQRAVLSVIGRIGGSRKSERKTAAVRANALRPRKKKNVSGEKMPAQLVFGAEKYSYYGNNKKRKTYDW